MESLGYKTIKILMFLLCVSCSSAGPLHYKPDNSSDVNGIKRSIVAVRLYVDGKLCNNEYESYFTTEFDRTGFICCSNLKYGDLIIDCASSYEKNEGQKIGIWARFISIQLGSNSMQINVSRELLGKNFYIDSLPFKPKQVFNISPSTKFIKKMSLKSKFYTLRKWKKPGNLVSKQNELNFRRYFALDTTLNVKPVFDLFNKEFYEIKFNDLKNN